MEPQTAVEQSNTEPVSPIRVLGGLDATCVVVGAIIGVGIFFTPSKIASLTGDGTLLLTSWAVAGVIAMCGALVFAELGSRYHASGAQYEVLRDAYGPPVGFLFVFCNATAIQAGAIGIIAMICVRHVGQVFGTDFLWSPPDALIDLAESMNTRVGLRHAVDWLHQLPQVGLSILLIGGLCVANAVGVRWGSRIQNFTVYAKVCTLLVITTIALFWTGPTTSAIESSTTDPVAEMSRSPVVLVLAALVPAFFAFGGWQQALWISGEVREPRRILPRAIVGGVLLVVVVYLLVNWAYLRLLGVVGMQSSDALAADAVASVFESVGPRLIALAVAVSAFGVMNAQLLSGPRLLYGLANDGRFFKPFAKLHTTFRTPVAAIALLGGMASVLLVLAGFNAVDKLLTGVVFIDGVFFALTGIALFVLRRKGLLRGEVDSFRVPWYPVVPLVFVVGELGVIIGAYLDPATLKAAIIGVIWILLAATLYITRFRRRG